MLKSNREMKQYTKEVFDRAVKVMGIEENQPKLVFTPTEVNRFYGRKMKFNKNYLGATFMSKNLVFISLKKHANIHALNDTIVHELYHIKYPNKRHCKSFDRAVQEYLGLLFDYGMDEQKQIIKYKGSKF